MVVSRTLSLSRERAGLATQAEAPDVVEKLILEALEGDFRVRGTYNGGSMLLEPLLLYREHDAAFLLAASVEREGRPPREIKVGSFRLSGLTEVCLTQEPSSQAAPLPADWTAGRSTRILVGLARSAT